MPNLDFVRIDGRALDEKRPVRITRDYTCYADGSVLVETGDTKVICTAMVEDRVPSFMRGEGHGWITAEYEMLPASTSTRKSRDRGKGKIDGRSVEIGRLIGRSLRSVVDLEALGERTVYIDCDVIQADGGTRTASITGAFVALYDALSFLKNEGKLKTIPVTDFVAAISVGVWQGQTLLDLCYAEDSQAIVDMNLVMTSKGTFIEVQGTGEGRPFTGDELNQMLVLGKKGIFELIKVQKEVLNVRQ